MKKSFLLTLTFLMLLSVALVGCSSSQSGENTEPAETSDGNTEAQAGDTLVFGRGGDSVGLDPITVTDGESLMVTKQIFDTLVDYGQQDTSIEPALATEWTVTDDGLVYTFTLREGVKFHDGTDFNADAVVYNFDRWMNGTVETFPYYVSMFGGFKGDESHVIKEVKALDPLTVEITLNRPQAPFLKNIAMVPFGIGSPAAIEQYGDKFTENPVGTGPFKFVSWSRNDKIVLEKNPDFWLEGYPKLDSVIYQAIPENSARLNALITGEIDIADGLNPSDLSQIESNPDLQVYKRPSMNVGYLGLTIKENEPDHPLNNKLVRQALNHAVDKQAIIDAFYSGLGEPAKNPMPPSVSGYHEGLEPYPYDLEKAKQLLAEAGYPNGFEMELWAMPVSRPYMPDGRKIAEVLQASFTEIGVKSEIVSFEWATYLEKASKGEADAFLLGWTGDNGDADNFLYALLDKDAIGSNNYSYYASEELHKILVEAQSNPNEAERNELYKQAQEIIKEDAPWVPLVHSTPLMAGKTNVAEFFPHPTGTDKLTFVQFK
ncbi:ABC transporter substrate-binding protein [Calidifontibacillus oryziterrae]|uniref:ABC transporter substrate-binding protein n=1 Tax=Calidifontibacillus oryziterrae TaxID=1191699 RepID=UPI0002FE1F0A|nr:ABC transporter substrate-binding protein [Calidifontibacillus oryziterrae]